MFYTAKENEWTSVKLNVKGFNLNEWAASFCQQGARRRRGGGVAEAWRRRPGRVPVPVLPRALPAWSSVRWKGSAGSCPGLLQVAPTSSLRGGFSVQLHAVLLELRSQQGVVVFQLLDLNKTTPTQRRC